MGRCVCVWCDFVWDVYWLFFILGGKFYGDGEIGFGIGIGFY